MSSRRRGDGADRVSRDHTQTQNFNTSDDKDAGPPAPPNAIQPSYVWPEATPGNYPMFLIKETAIRQRRRGYQNELHAEEWQRLAPYEAAFGGVQYEWQSPSPLATATKKLIRLIVQAQRENRKGLQTANGGYNEFYAMPRDGLSPKSTLEPFVQQFAKRFPAANVITVLGRTKRLGLRFPKQIGVTKMAEWLALRPHVKPGLWAWREARLMLKAAIAGIGPEVYAARFLTGNEALDAGFLEGGLVVIMEAAESSLSSLLNNETIALSMVGGLAVSLERLIYRASVDSELRLLMIDIKPDNVVVRLEDTTGAVTALTPLLIDFDGEFTYSYAGEDQMKPHCLYVVNMTMFILSFLCWLPNKQTAREPWDTFLTRLQTQYRARIRDDSELVELARAGESDEPLKDSVLCRELAEVLLRHRERSILHDQMAENVDFYAVAKHIINQATHYLTTSKKYQSKPCQKLRDFPFNNEEPIWKQFVLLAKSNHAANSAA